MTERKTNRTRSISSELPRATLVNQLNIRIDEKLKKQAGKALAGVGLDMSGAIKVFLTQVVTEKGLPFTPTNNPSVIKARWDAQVADALKNGKR